MSWGWHMGGTWKREGVRGDEELGDAVVCAVPGLSVRMTLANPGAGLF
jgi:hypothetical protein